MRRNLVSLNFDEPRGAICIFSKPIVEKLGNTKKIEFIIKNNKIGVDIV